MVYGSSIANSFIGASESGLILDKSSNIVCNWFVWSVFFFEELHDNLGRSGRLVDVSVSRFRII